MSIVSSDDLTHRRRGEGGERCYVGLVPTTEMYVVARVWVGPDGKERTRWRENLATADDCVAALRGLCAGTLSATARTCLWDAGFWGSGALKSRAFARAYYAAGLKPLEPFWLGDWNVSHPKFFAAVAVSTSGRPTGTARPTRIGYAKRCAAQ